jgi:hypothetical protein
MKKIFMSVIVASGMLVLAGCGNKPAVQPTTDQGAVKTQEQQPSETVQPKKGLLSFLTGGNGVKCTIEDKSGTITVISDGTKARIEGMDFPALPGKDVQMQKGYMINDGTWAYIWSGTSGTKFNIKDMQEISKANGGQQEDPSAKMSNWEDWAKSMETSGTKYDCANAAVSDSDFVPPSDVKFQDMGELVKQMNQMKNAVPNIPGGKMPQIPQ